MAAGGKTGADRGRRHDEDGRASRRGAGTHAMTMQLTLAVHRARRMFPPKRPSSSPTAAGLGTSSPIAWCGSAGVLRSLGVGPGDRVAMLSHSSDRYLEFFFAAFWAGGIAVPVSTRYALPETAFLMQDSGAKVLLVGDDFTGMAEALKPQCPELKHIVLLRRGAAARRHDRP